MKKYLWTTCCMALIVTACGSGKNGVSVVSDTNDEMQSTYAIHSEIPQIRGIADVATLKDINDRLEKIGKDERAKFLSDIKDVYIDPKENQKNKLSITFKTATISPQLISIIVEASPCIAGTAHPNLVTIPFVYNVDLKKQITFTDLFNTKTKYLERLSSLSIKQLIDASKKNNSYYEAKEQTIQQGASPKIENFKTFSIENGNLILTFDPYQVAAYADGIQSVTLARAEITDVLSNEGRKMMSETEKTAK